MAVQNIDGCDALSSKFIYRNRKEEREGFHVSGKSWWNSGRINLILVTVFSIMDAMVLFSIFDECMTQSVVMGIIMTLGIAVILNVMPLIIARFVHAALENTAKNAKLMMTIFIIGFLLIYGGTVYLRFAYSDMYGQVDQQMILQNSVSGEVSQIVNNSSSPDADKGTAVVLLLSISPFITSLIGFGIAYITDDEIKSKIEYLEVERIEIDEKISDTQAAIMQLEFVLKRGVQKDLDIDEEAMNTSIENVIARCDVLKSSARFYLAEFVNDPSATSKLSQEMMIDDTDEKSDLRNMISEKINDDYTNNRVDNLVELQREVLV